MSDWCQVNEKYYRYTVNEPTKEDLLLQSLCIPTQTEIRNQLGSKLADVFFENLSSEGRIILGLQPALTAPEEVWINPDLRLKGRVRCKPVPEPHVLHQKAFTHQTILELGQQYIESLHLKMREEIRESLKSQAAELEAQCDKRLTEALENAKIEADEQCKQVVGTLMEHFDRCLSEVVQKNKLRLRKECQFRVAEERAELASYMLSQLEEEVERRDSELCRDFHATLDGELNALAAKYVKQIDSERRVAREVLQEVVRKYETTLADLRSEMEMCSFVDVCRAISEEKAKHERESKEAEERLRKETTSMVKRMSDLEDRNKTLQEMATERSKRITQYEKKMWRLIQEFQRFVNFALESAPAHAEFLLSMQRMMMRKHRQDSLLSPEDYEEYKNCLSGKRAGEEEAPAGSPQRASAGSEKEGPNTRREKGEDSKYTFDYLRFKYTLLKNLVKGVKFERERTKPCRQEEPCREEEEEEEEGEGEMSEESDEELREYKQSLTLVGETEKEHMRPAKTFLTERVKALTELCRDDPAMARMMLGRSGERGRSSFL